MSCRTLLSTYYGHQGFLFAFWPARVAFLVVEAWGLPVHLAFTEKKILCGVLDNHACIFFVFFGEMRSLSMMEVLGTVGDVLADLKIVM